MEQRRKKKRNCKKRVNIKATYHFPRLDLPVIYYFLTCKGRISRGIYSGHFPPLDGEILSKLKNKEELEKGLKNTFLKLK